MKISPKELPGSFCKKFCTSENFLQYTGGYNCHLGINVYLLSVLVKSEVLITCPNMLIPRNMLTSLMYNCIILSSCKRFCGGMMEIKHRHTAQFVSILVVCNICTQSISHDRLRIIVKKLGILTRVLLIYFYIVLLNLLTHKRPSLV